MEQRCDRVRGNVPTMTTSATREWLEQDVVRGQNEKGARVVGVLDSDHLRC